MEETEPLFAGNSRFKPVRRVGQGGMGVVYEALDQERGVKVALKTLHALSPEGLLAFKREFREFQGLEHPNLVNLGELYAEADQWFFTMELLEGRSFLGAVTNRLDNSAESTGGSSETLRITPQGSHHAGAVLSTGNLAHFDDKALREAIRQLARGLIALHDAGKVHRDIKPSNVLVTHQGRVVLLDYGVAMNLVKQQHDDDSAIVGTVGYMAPEQAAASNVGIEADWYSLGVMLFEALTGTLPFVGSAIEILEIKQREPAPRASSLNPNVPADLDSLCADLLNIDPRLRPTGRQVLDRLGGRKRRDLESMLTGHASLVGRQGELDALEAALAKAIAGTGTNVCVISESGLGKTALVRQFLGKKLNDPRVALLMGACYEREAVPYKGFDGVIDSVSLFLSRLRREEVAAYVPPNAYLLVKAFPVLGSVDAFARAPKPAMETPDPQELRQQLWVALREVFVRLSKAYTLVLFIDDLQWAAADTLTLFAELFRAPNAPQVFWVTTVRAENDVEAEHWRKQLGSLTETPPTFLRLARLSPADAATCAKALLGSQALTDAQVELLAKESGGHPLFIDELVRQSATEGDGDHKPAPLALEDAIWSRISSLDDAAQRVLTLLSLAPGRMVQSLLARASGVDPAQWNKVLAALRSGHLARTYGARASDSVEPYHDRIRAAIRKHVAADALKGHHRRLAESLDPNAPNEVELLTFHWAEAGEFTFAAKYAELAGEKADRALSFDRAAEFYRQSLEWSAGAKKPEPWVKLGDSLSNAGRGAQAAEAYLSAAQLQPPTDRLDLQRRAAEELLRSGHIDRGIALMTEVLKELDISTPKTPTSALVDLLWRRARLRLRGLGVSPKQSLDAKSTLQLDATWSASNGFSMIDPIRGSDFQTRNLMLALELGDAERVASGLAMEAAFIACDGDKEAVRATELVTRAENLGSTSTSEKSKGLTTLVRGVIAFQNGRWVEADRWFSSASLHFRERCTGVTWERDSCDFFHLATLFYLGQFNRLQEIVPTLMQEADTRGDLYAGSNLRLSTINSVWLSLDQPAQAAAHANEAISRWSNRGYLAHSYYFLVAAVNRLLFEGKNAEAWALVEEHWAPLKRSLLLRVQVVRIEAHHLRARAAFAVGGSALKAGRASVKVLETEKVPHAAAMAVTLRAWDSHHEGRAFSEIVVQLKSAEALLRQAGMLGFAAAVRWGTAHRGSVAERESAEAAWRALGVQSPDRMTAMLGMGWLTQSS